MATYVGGQVEVVVVDEEGFCLERAIDGGFKGAKEVVKEIEKEMDFSIRFLEFIYICINESESSIP